MRVEVILTFLVTQLGERVYDNTENNIQANDVDDDLEACVVHEFEEVLLHFVVEVDGLGDIADAATITESFIELCDEALKHGETIVLADNVGVVGVDVVVVHTVLQVEESHDGVNVDKNHHKHDGHHHLHNVHRDGQHYILQHDRSIDHVQQVERVVNVLTEFAEKRNHEVKHIVLKSTVLNEKVCIEQMVLRLGKPVSEVHLILVEIELVCFRTLDNEDHVCHLVAHLVNVETVIVVEYAITIFLLIFLDHVTPFDVRYQLLLVDSEEENEDKTTTALNIAEVLDGTNDPFWHL